MEDGTEGACEPRRVSVQMLVFPLLDLTKSIWLELCAVLCLAKVHL